MHIKENKESASTFQQQKNFLKPERQNRNQKAPSETPGERPNVLAIVTNANGSSHTGGTLFGTSYW